MKTCKSASHSPAAATDAVVTLAATTSTQHVLHSISWGLTEAASAAISLAVTGLSGSGTWALAIKGAGTGQHVFDPPLAGVHGGAVVVTLPSGGGSAKGSVAVTYDSILRR